MARLPFVFVALLLVAPPTLAQHGSGQAEEPRFTAETGVGAMVGLLPLPVTSFGAATLDGHVYVLGGYTGRPHDYRTRYQSAAFYRVNSHDPSAVELLPNDRRIQSVGLVADGDHLVRIGGMTIVDDVTRSTTECARFSPEQNEWTSFPPLPRARSSHEAAVIGRTLFVAGGWSLDGDGADAHWFDESLSLDLDAPDLGWTSIPQPFRRRALGVAATADRLVVIGGMTSDGEFSSDVDVFDPAAGSWSVGPRFPGPGFGVAAVGVGSTVVASGMDGAVYAWRSGDPEWRPLATLTFPRFFHQLVSTSPESVLALGGIDRDLRTRHIEEITLAPPAPRGAEVLTFELPTRDETPARAGGFLRGHELFLFGKRGVRIDLRTLSVAETGAPRGGRGALRTLVSAGGRSVWGIRDGAKAVDRFDFDAAEWINAGPIESPYGDGGWALDGRELWRFGGRDGGQPHDAVQHASSLHLDLGFEPAETRLPRPRAAFASAMLDGRYYLVGGRTTGDATVDVVDVFDFDQLTWSTAPGPPRARVDATLVPLDGRLLLVGGFVEDESRDLVAARSILSFDPDARAWTTFVEALDVDADVLHAFPYRGHLVVAAPGSSPSSVEVRFVRPPVARPELESAGGDPSPGDRWSSFRGEGFGRTSARDLPTSWSDERGVAWSASIPGVGQSSPVVRDGQVIVTSVDGDEKERAIVSCYDTSDGALVWSREFDAAIRIKRTDMVSQGAPTPAVDAERIYAFFESGDLLALDRRGELVWRRSLATEYGTFKGNHGLGGSVALTDGGVVVLVDHDGPSYLLCVDKATGANLWKVDRTPRISWTTPVVARTAAGEEVVVSSAGTVEGFDARTGRPRWSAEGVAGNTIPSPTVLGDLVFVAASSGDGNVAFARPHGDDAQPRVIWRAPRSLDSGFGSPLVLDRHVLVVNKAGVLSCLARESGALLWKHRLAASGWATPIAAAEVVYFFGTDGVTTLLSVTDEGPVVVGENRLAVEGRVVGVAAVDDALLVREPSRLRCLRRD